MPNSLARLACTALLFGIATLSPLTHGWAPETRVQMVDESIRFMPHSLRIALEARRDLVQRSMLESLARHDRESLSPPWAGGTLDVRLEAEARDLVAATRANPDFDRLAQRFGRLALWIMEAGFPPAMGDAAAPGRTRHFREFCLTRRERFPLVFYGHEDDFLAQGDFRGFGLAVMQQARAQDDDLARIYGRAGDPPNPTMFDDRSVPFAVASLSYSKTVTYIVRAWIAAWEQSGGDMGRTPYWEKKG